MKRTSKNGNSIEWKCFSFGCYRRYKQFNRLTSCMIIYLYGDFNKYNLQRFDHGIVEMLLISIEVIDRIEVLSSIVKYSQDKSMDRKDLNVFICIHINHACSYA